VSSDRLTGNCKVDSVQIVRKRPVANRLIRNWGESVTTVA
jgi:hypothetical protein